MSSSRENLSPQVLQNIARELKKILRSPPEGIKIHVNEENLTDIQADIEGPVGTPYEGGFFRCKLVLGSEYPSAPPRGFFLTKIFHPNVSLNGDICVNTLKKDWKPDLGMSHIFQVIRCLLIVPFPESALNEDASKLFLDSYDEFAKRASLMTSIHAARVCRVDSEESSLVLNSGDCVEIEKVPGKFQNLNSASETGVKNKSRLQRKKSERKKSLKRL